MPDTINATEEQRLLAAVKQAAHLVDDEGRSPDEAIEKVARAEGFGPGNIRLLAYGYNTGRQTGQWRAGGNILDKLAHYQLADPDAVIASIYHGQTPSEKAARDRVAEDYLLPPSWLDRPARVKTALVPAQMPPPPAPPPAPPPGIGMGPPPGPPPGMGMGMGPPPGPPPGPGMGPPPGPGMGPPPGPGMGPPPGPGMGPPPGLPPSVDKAAALVQRAKQAAEEARRLASAAEDRVRGQVAGLVGYFKQAAHARLPFAGVELAARTYVGDAAVPLLDLVYRQARLHEKRGADAAVQRGVDPRGEPFTGIRAAIKAAEDCQRLRLAAARARDKVAEVREEAYRPFAEARPPRPPPGPWSGAAAGLLGVKGAGFGEEVAAIAAGDVLGTAAHKRLEEGIAGAGKPDQLDELDDPATQQEIRNVRTQSALDQIMSDPGNPLSRHPPAELAGAYNALVQKQPHLAGQTAALQPLLEQHFKDRAALGKSAALEAALGAGIQRSLGSMPKTKEDLIQDAYLELEDPAHENELRKIRAHAMLNHMLTDPDDPISGHDPHKVLRAYNDISSLAPRLAESPVALGPVLRRRLEGHTEPFESKEMVDTEKALAGARLAVPGISIVHGMKPPAVAD